jgi:DNA polymerase/3'-5' exonuclease PolX
LPGIGKALAEKIKEIVESGRLSQLEDLEQALLSILQEVLRIPGEDG